MISERMASWMRPSPLLTVPVRESSTNGVEKEKRRKKKHEEEVCIKRNYGWPSICKFNYVAMDAHRSDYSVGKLKSRCDGYSNTYGKEKNCQYTQNMKNEERNGSN